jgi:hypothetical protein
MSTTPQLKIKKRVVCKCKVASVPVPVKNKIAPDTTYTVATTFTI